MNDDVKAIEWLRKMVTETAHGVTVLGLEEGKALLAHINGFDARLAAAREEQREACFRRVETHWHNVPLPERDYGPGAVVMNTPLTATPLADALEAERAMNDLGDVALKAAKRTEETLRAQKEEEWQAHLAEKAAFVSEVADLRARVAAMDVLLEIHRGYARGEQRRAENVEAERDEARTRADEFKTVLKDVTAERDELRAFVNELHERNVATLVPGTNGDMADLGWGRKP